MKKTVFLYCGKGTGRVSLQETAYMLAPQFQVEWIDTKEVRRGFWKKSAFVFAIPGGADLPYCRDLEGEGNRQIASFVQEGGRYLGICAGSYYAGSFVEFDKGGALEVIGKRELAFFPGTVQGPTFPPFAYQSAVGSKAVRLSSHLIEEEIACFYHGGGVFCKAGSFASVEVIGRYVDSSEAAVVLCRVGKGRAMLSAVHFEMRPESIEISAVAEELRRFEKQRSRFVSALLARLFESEGRSN